MHTSATRLQVAQEAGVAESTVSRALSDSPLISAQVKQRVRDAAARLGYVPSRQAARFATRRTLHLGFVIRSYRSFPPFSRAYFPALLDGAVLGAEQRGYFITIVLDRHHDRTDDIARLVDSREVDGLLLSVTPTQDERVRALCARQVPFVLINNRVEDAYCVDCNPAPGMGLALSHLAELGHRRIGYVTGDMSYHNAVERLQTFRDRSAELGLEGHVVEGDFSRRSGYAGASTLLRAAAAPSAIMTACDREAMGVLEYCREHSIRVPEEVSVVGFDNLDPARNMSPALTTVDNPVTRTALVAAQMLIDVIEGKLGAPQARLLDTGFVVRESSGPKGAGR